MSETASDDFIMVYEDHSSDEEEDGMLSSDDTNNIDTDHMFQDEPRSKRAPLQRHGVACKLCSEDIRGERWLCIDCSDWNLCSFCFHGVSESVHPMHTFVRVSNASDIHAPTKGESSTPVIHLDVLCSSCQCPILGCRYECIADECENKVNLCQNCESLPLQSHKASHPMIKYKTRKEMSSKSAMLEYSQQGQQKKRYIFGNNNLPAQVSNKGLWELPDQAVVTEQVLKARKELSMEIEKDKETPWGSHLSPTETFSRSWDIKNCGTRAWPKGIFVTRVSPAVFTPQHFKKRIVSDDVVRQGKTIEIRFVGLTAPAAPRTYVEVWALCDSEDRFFGERLEIRVCVGEEEDPKASSDRYFGLKDALARTKEAKEDLDREIDGAGALEPCKMTVSSSTLQWHGKQQSLTCSWYIINNSRLKFPIGCQLRRTRRTIGNALSIDDSEAAISVPQGLNPGHHGTITIIGIRVVSEDDAKDQSGDSNQKQKDTSNNISNWFTDTWRLVDGHGTEFGENLHFAQSFQYSDLKADKRWGEDADFNSQGKLWPDGEWKGEGDWMYRSSI
jgi:hypothetical protein